MVLPWFPLPIAFSPTYCDCCPVSQQYWNFGMSVCGRFGKKSLSVVVVGAAEYYDFYRRTWGAIQQRSFSSLFCRRPFWKALVWAGVSTLWCCPSSISSVDHGVAHPPRCPEGWFMRGCRDVWHARSTSHHLWEHQRPDRPRTASATTVGYK